MGLSLDSAGEQNVTFANDRFGLKVRSGVEMLKGEWEFCLLTRKKPNIHPEKSLSAIFMSEKTRKNARNDKIMF